MVVGSWRAGRTGGALPRSATNHGRLIARFGAVAAALGGAAWIGKAGAILATGDQPPLLFEVAPLLFAIGLVGLRLLLGARPGRTGDVGGWVAVAALILSVLDLVASSPASTSGSDFSPFTFVAFLCVLAALVLLGLSILRRPTLPQRARRLPLLLGILTFPLIAVGGALETMNERLLEVPLLLLGLAWMWLGLSMWQAVERAEAFIGPDGVDGAQPTP